uniref:GIY-YIG endonuclease n=1 Tax=Rhizopus microsporus TaxID=58291 RepID=UPI002A832AFD|nr:GIY-YIG endonuclease [Rhizopus microsporus]WPA89443.1 GIY-YIG endonuclease [Rhizopus microsporus]
MLLNTLNNLLLNVITFHSKNGTNVSMNELLRLNILTSLIKSYLLTLYPKVQDSVCQTLAKLITEVVFKKSTITSFDLLLNNSLVKSILTDFGMDFELENLSIIHPINSEKINHKYPLDLSSIKSTYVKVYFNSESEVSNIMLDNKNLTGIYCWYNNINGKQYVGSANNLSQRLSAYYFISRLLSLDNLINRAILKYGHYNFSLVILEVLGSTNSVSNSDLLLREQYYIDLYNTIMPNGYNMRPSDRTKGFNHTDFSKNLISNIQSGRTLSEETKAKISMSLKGRIITDEQKLKISIAKKNKTPLAANKSRSKKVWVYDIDLNLINNVPFLSVGKCLDYMKINRNAFYKIVDTGKLYNNYYYYTQSLKK